jgi:cyclic pyranopterin phosphate synthase
MDEEGRPNMVNVGEKNVTKRSATASGRIYLNAVAFELLGRVNQLSPTKASQDISEEAIAKAKLKGDPLVVAQLAGIMASKSTANIIPLCHPIPLTHVSVTLTPEMHAGEPSVFCEATAECDGKTGVEMEALTAVNVALLTVWDMLKAVAGRDMKITDLVVRKKSGGKSGDFVRA